RARGIKGDEGIALVEYSAGIVGDDGLDIPPALVPAGGAGGPGGIRRGDPGGPEGASLAGPVRPGPAPGSAVDAAAVARPRRLAVARRGPVDGDRPREVAGAAR